MQTKNISNINYTLIYKIILLTIHKLKTQFNNFTLKKTMLFPKSYYHIMNKGKILF
jgi:hypothetical protein